MDTSIGIGLIASTTDDSLLVLKGAIPVRFHDLISKCVLGFLGRVVSFRGERHDSWFYRYLRRKSVKSAFNLAIGPSNC